MSSRGIRNNNPGNIRKGTSRFQGEVFPSMDLEFKEFESAVWGLSSDLSVDKKLQYSLWYQHSGWDNQAVGATL